MIEASIWQAFAISGTGALALTLSVARGWTHALDARVLAAVKPRKPYGADGKPTRRITAARDLAALGGDTLRTIFLAGCMLGLLVVGRPRDAVLMAAIFFGARLFLYLLKAAARRNRPELFDHGVVTYTTSFPSGHTYMATVLFLAAALIVPEHSADTLRIAAVIFGLTVSALIGWTRLILGIHWPSDVLVGWLAGIAWACGWSMLA